MLQESFAQDILNERFPTPNNFSLMIEKMSSDMGLGYVDTILHYCETKGIDYEVVGKLINPTLKDKIKHEFTRLNMLPKTNKGSLKKAKTVKHIA